MGLLSKDGGKRLYTFLFADEISDARRASAETDRTRAQLPEFAAFFIRSVIAGEPDRPLNSPEDLAAVLRPVLDELEKGVEHWLNRQHEMRSDVETEITVKKLQTIEDFVDELQLRGTVPPDEYFETAAVLERAGLDYDEINALIGEDPDGDDEDESETGSEYPMQQLVEFPLETLTRLIAAGEITQDQHTEAIRRKSERGDIDRL
jgi:AcrR family transcriptional regulator